jgi:hypothetical protein
VINLTDSFTWEELPTRDTDTGYMTKAGYIPKIQTVAKHIIEFVFVFHATQSIIRIVLNHDMVFSKWYPFDATVSPAYEIVNFSQVILRNNLLPFEL